MRALTTALLVLCYAFPSYAGDLKLQISCESETLKKGTWPKVTITITNTGNTAVTLVQPGDGSRCKWRTPVIGWSVISADDPKATHPQEPFLFTGARCGNINALNPGEVFKLQPGERKDLGEWADVPLFPDPGTYRVVFYYFNQPDLQWHGLPLGEHDEKAMRMVKASTKCELISNELTFTVEE